MEQPAIPIKKIDLINSKQFKQFIKSLLVLAKIDPDIAEKFLTRDILELFEQAFTDKSYYADSPDAEKNSYELLEFQGDGIVKAILVQYIPRRFPNKKHGVYSKIRRMLEQEGTLSVIALKLGFWDYTRADEKVKTFDRKSTLENVFEAFIGALVKTIDIKLDTRGLGYRYAMIFLENQLDQKEIDISPEKLDDPVTRLNEVYKSSSLKGGKYLRWGDAKYKYTNIEIPQVTDLPDSASPGDLIFNKKDTFVYFWNRYNKWEPVSRVPNNLTLQPAKVPTADLIKVWYVTVLGYPFNQEKVMGIGVHLRKEKDQPSAKMMAADNALYHLKRMGFEKEYND